MKKISDREVELTQTEMAASDLFETYLDCDYGIHQAIAQVRKAYWMYDLPQAFYDWLAFPS